MTDVYLTPPAPAPEDGVIVKYDSGDLRSSGGAVMRRIFAGMTGKYLETFRLISGYVKLVTTAAGGNRYINVMLGLGIGLKDPNPQYITGIKSDPIAPLSTVELGFGPQQVFTNTTDGNDQFCGIGDGFIFSGDDFISCFINNSEIDDGIRYYLQLLYIPRETLIQDIQKTKFRSGNKIIRDPFRKATI